MKLWIGIVIGLLVGFVIGLIMYGGLINNSLETTHRWEKLYYDEKEQCDESLKDWMLYYETLDDDCGKYLNSCYDLVDEWAEMYDDLLDECYDTDYDYNYDYETEDFMVIGGIEYDCTYNRYNCMDFPEWADAQTLFTYCKTEGKGDIHYLDGDNDGTACEELNWDYGESTLNFGLLK